MLAVVLLLMVACGAAGGYVSHAKRREPIEGVVLGALIGPIGLLVAVLLPDGESKPAATVETPRERFPERGQSSASRYMVDPNQFKDVQGI